MLTRLIAKLNPTTHTPNHIRQMANSRRVGDRSKKKRVQDLELVTEKWKIFSKIHLLMEVIKSQPEHVTPITNLAHYRRQINLPKPHKVSDFLRKSPALFDFCKDCKGVLWVGMTAKGEELMEEEERLIGLHEDKAAEYVTRCLMMCVDRRLDINKVANFRRDFGLPVDFSKNWVYKYPDLFRVVRGDDGVEYLELVEWKHEWAVTELEKRVSYLCGDEEEEIDSMKSREKLALAFPMKFPSNFKDVYKFKGKLEMFQKREYLSPYAYDSNDVRSLEPGSDEFNKRAVAIMHEILSFTLEKRLVTHHLTHFRQEMMMPQKLMRLLLKHFGIFYVSERGKRFHVFLNEGYHRSELIEKCPLVVWREKVHQLIGYRGKKKRVANFEELSDVEDKSLWNDDSEDDEYLMEFEEDDEEMDVEEVSRAYDDA